MDRRDHQHLIKFGFSLEEFKFLMGHDAFRHDLLRAASIIQFRRLVFRAAKFLDDWEKTHPEMPKFPRALKPAIRLIPWDK